MGPIEHYHYDYTRLAHRLQYSYRDEHSNFPMTNGTTTTARDHTNFGQSDSIAACDRTSTSQTNVMCGMPSVLMNDRMHDDTNVCGDTFLLPMLASSMVWHMKPAVWPRVSGRNKMIPYTVLAFGEV